MRPSPAVIIVGALAATGHVASARSLSVAGYVERLEEIRQAVETGDLRAARRRSGELLRLRVSHGDESVLPDRTVLAPLANAADLDEARELAPRLAALERALRREALEPGAARAPDVRLLERLREEESFSGPEKGGEVTDFPFDRLSVPEWLVDRLARLGRWLLDKLGRLLDWLYRWTRVEREPAGTSADATRLLVIVLVIMIVTGLAFAVFYVLRMRRDVSARAAPQRSAAGVAASSRDADPLSRTATEWERYARELREAGRAREAIRAWYHAVLVTLFRVGVLHYRKGRTNWEYAYSLPPAAAWRSRYMDLTREFEREWYGRESSDPGMAGGFARSAEAIITESAGRYGARGGGGG